MNFEYISSKGDTLSLSNGENYKLVNFDNQTAVSTSISSIVLGGADGDTVNNIQAQPRSIVLDLRILAEVEATKRKILQVIKPKQKGTIRWEQEERTVEIKGIVESIELSRWTNESLMQITMHCEQPFWEDDEETVLDIDAVTDLHYFTDLTNDMLYFTSTGIAFGEIDPTRIRNVYNEGDVEVGLEITIVAYGTVTNPILYGNNNKFFGCGHGTGTKKIVMTSGDVIKITTGKNEKSATLNGTNILGKIKPNSTWLQLEAGNNTFQINSDDSEVENMAFYLTYKTRYV